MVGSADEERSSVKSETENSAGYPKQRAPTPSCLRLCLSVFSPPSGARSLSVICDNDFSAAGAGASSQNRIGVSPLDGVVAAASRRVGGAKCEERASLRVVCTSAVVIFVCVKKE